MITARLSRVPLWLALCALAAADRYHPAAQQAAQRAAQRAARGGVQPRAPLAAELTAQHWYEEAQAGIRARRARLRAGSDGAARNVVMFLGDGMSVPTLAAARILLGQKSGRPGEEASLFFESFPTTGLTKTYCVDSQIADSACSATAYLCGVKNNDGMVGLTAAVPRRDCGGSLAAGARLDSVAAWALADGRDAGAHRFTRAVLSIHSFIEPPAGIVTTTRVTHASPAGAYARAASRYWESDAGVKEDGQDPDVCPDIAYQLVHTYPGNQFKVILGGGRREFLPSSYIDEEGTSGLRTDGRNLLEEWQLDKRSRNVTYQYVWNRDQLMGAAESLPDFLLGLFEGSHMKYTLLADARTEPTLAELTEVAIRSLSRNKKGFFLFVEGGRIDHAHHDNLVHLALDETMELSAAVKRAAELLPEDDSLIVVTADHAHVMTFNGYSRRGNDILGQSNDHDRAGVPYMTLSYSNGPGFRPHVNGNRIDITVEPDYGSAAWRAHVDAPLASETHGGDDVAVFARGPQHAMFAGLYEQSQLPHLMGYAACLGPGLHACSAAHRAHLAHFAPALLLAALLCLLRRLRV